MALNWQDIVFNFIGGLGLFLFSIKYMGDGLQQAAGDRLRYYIDKYTSNPFLGIIVGLAMSALIQSSSGVTVITVGLVSAGLLNLRQAIGIVMGANIGTTITSFMIGFKLGDYALPMIALGAALLFFTSNRQLNNIGRVIFGVGGIFFSLNLMGDAVEPLKSVAAFRDYLATLGDKPLMGVLIGTVLTCMVQASSAIIGIVQGLHGSDLLDLQGAIPILLGSNIGTCITAVLASIGTNVAAKRVAWAHVLFNVIGTVIFMVFLSPFTAFISFLQEQLSLTPEMAVAFAHGAFNITNTIILLPFISLLAFLVTKLIPGQDEAVTTYGSLYLDRILVTQAPAIALGNAKKELLHLASYAIQALEASYHYWAYADEKYAGQVHAYEKAVNSIDEELTTYLIAISNEALNPSENEVLAGILDATRDLERIGDHSENLVSLISNLHDKETVFSETAVQEVKQMYDLTYHLITDTIHAVEKRDKVMASTLVERHRHIQSLERQIRKNHVHRLNEGVCTAQAGMTFVDILSHYTRMTDHAVNLAHKILENQI
ncbi:Na/Pi cotransporter family protein [Streptococcus plurextorum]|uniref:Na/Pi cotransporter family protein n=1 Tax=Streptococcus plurextorum TaxID=456876 RepID=UPI00040B486A|nr:Na/Pi cotransporter family protein [Streptococcus plurextorum]